METVQGISKFKSTLPTVITIGTFDGVHIGHRKILQRVTNSAKQGNLNAVLLTFFPHPRMVLQKENDLKLLNTLEEKINILERLGLDFIIVHPFTTEFSRLSAVEFVRDILVNQLKAKKVVIGYDHRFGRNRNADINELIAFGNTLDFDVEQISVQEVNEVSVSSTKIRLALEEGAITTANEYLGYNYMISGVVKKGKGLGRQLAFPTANIVVEESYKLIPKNGVYLVKGTINGKDYHGMMNIGFNPTVNGKKKSIEVHFFDFNQDLYEKKIRVELLRYLRDEHKFNSVEELKLQLKKDQEASLKLISN